MTNRRSVVVLLLTTNILLAAQTDPSFEVASIKRNVSAEASLAGFSGGGRFTATNATLRQLIELAYGPLWSLLDDQIVGGPRWIDTDRFDVVAKAAEEPPAAPNGPPVQMFGMLRNLLAERFELVVHTETRERPLYALVLARRDGELGPQLMPTDTDCTTGRGRPRVAGEKPPCGGSGGFGRLEVRSMPITGHCHDAVAPDVLVVDRVNPPTEN
jgi:uncharacterized protein (TIGR03435 family)